MYYIKKRSIKIQIVSILLVSILFVLAIMLTQISKPAQAAVTYPTGFPFATFDKPTHLHIGDIWASNDATMALLTSLQGIVNKQQPEIYLIQERWNQDARWLNDLAKAHKFTYEWHNDPLDLFVLYKSRVQGAVVYDPNFNSSIIYAAALAGVNNWVMVHPDMISYVQSQGITIQRDLRTPGWGGDKVSMYNDLYTNVWSSMSHNMLFSEGDQFTDQPYSYQTFPEQYIDYLVATKTLNLRLDAQNDTSARTLVENIFADTAPLTPVMGLYLSDSADREGYTVSFADKNGKLAHGGLAPANNTVLGSKIEGDVPPFPIRKVDLRKITDNTKVYVTLNLTDGDTTWSPFVFRERRWDPDKLHTDLPPQNWEMPLMFYDQAPGMQSFYVNSSSNESFSTGLGGIGYANPTVYSLNMLEQYTQLTEKSLKRSGIRFVDTTFGSFGSLVGGSQITFNQTLDVYAKNLNIFGMVLGDYATNANSDDQYIFSGVQTTPFALSHFGTFGHADQGNLNWLADKENSLPKPQFWNMMMINDGSANYTDYTNFVKTIESWPNYKLLTLGEHYAAINPDFILAQARKFLIKARTEISGAGLYALSLASASYTQALDYYYGATSLNANTNYKLAAANGRDTLGNIFNAYKDESKYIDSEVSMELNAYETGWESDDWWQSTTALSSQGVSGYGGSGSPSIAVSNASPVYHGQNSLLFEGSDVSSTSNSFIYYAITDRNNTRFKPITVTDGTTLSYWIYHTDNSHVAVDAHFTDNTYLKDITTVNGYIKDQNNVRIHPSTRTDALNQWVYVEVDLSDLNGKTIDYLSVGYDDDQFSETGNFSAKIDDLKISKIKTRTNEQYIRPKTNSNPLAYTSLDLGGTADAAALGGQAKTLSSTGSYIYWQPGTTIPSGEYNVYVRAKGSYGMIGLAMKNDTTGTVINRLPVTVNSSNYKDYYAGTIRYDKSYNVRFDDWSAPGLWVDAIYLVPIWDGLPQLNLGGTTDTAAVNGDTKIFNETTAVNHFTWNLGQTLKPGRYEIYSRARGGTTVAGERGTTTWLTLSQNNQTTSATIKTWKSWLYPTIKIKWGEDRYSDIYMGTIDYDGTYNLQLSDLSSSPGATTYIDLLYLVDVTEKYMQIDLQGTADVTAKGGQATTRTTTGIYSWWPLYKTLNPGTFNVYIRAKTGGANKNISLQQVNDNVNTPLRILNTTINSTEYKDFLIGKINYDGSYDLRLSDWSDAGISMDQVYLVPIGE